MENAAGSLNGEGSEWKSSSAVVAAVLVALVSWYSLRRTKKAKGGLAEARPLPPGPRGLPLLGSLPFLGSDLHVCFKELADSYGPVVSLRLGAKFCVVLSSPEAAKEALKDQDAVFANHDVPIVASVSSYGCKNILWAPYGPHWRMVRKVAVREMLSPGVIDGLYDLRRAEIRRTVEEVRRSANKPLDVRELVSAAAMNMATEMLWGGSVAQNWQDRAAVERDVRHAEDELIALFAVPNVSDFYPALAWLDLQGLVRRMRKLSAYIGRTLDGIIEVKLRTQAARGQGDAAAVSVEKRRRDFLQVLLDLSQNPDPEAPMTMDVIKALLLDLLAAGTDTTSTTVEWAMAELLYHPEKMKRAKEEIAAVVGEGNAVEESHLPGLRYLHASVSETLRLHPPLPLLVPYRPSSTCTIAGYQIPEGSKVFINAWAIQRDPSVWEDAPEFKPERFLSEAGVTDYAASAFRYLPFGAGRRICAAASLGDRMVKFILASLLHSADWALPEGGKATLDLKEKFGLVMRKEKALVAIPTPR